MILQKQKNQILKIPNSNSWNKYLEFGISKLEFKILWN
ncbi:hypothetical protein FEM21_18170 [Flavobacterium seoulense]|uniref:Uncharacterized protein n=1 Tax=Flavobacterium seoulense TaxID=1492738 RepID=A0A066WMY4_9FLAO|nr:hypothetical protein FEM21_18170 [Flavobacterium seoulense]